MGIFVNFHCSNKRLSQTLAAGQNPTLWTQLHLRQLTWKKQHFHLGNSKKVWEGHDNDKLIQGIPLSSSSSTSAVPMVSLLHCTWKKAAKSWPPWLFLLILGHPETRTAPKWTKLGHRGTQIFKRFLKLELCFLIFLTLQNQLCFLVGRAHKKGSWSF